VPKYTNASEISPSVSRGFEQRKMYIKFQKQNRIQYFTPQCSRQWTYFIDYFNHNKELILEISKLKLVRAAEAVTVSDGVTTIHKNISHPFCSEHLPCRVHVCVRVHQGRCASVLTQVILI